VSTNERQAPDQRVLDIRTPSPPALLADPLLGTLLAWVGPQARTCIATDQTQPPFQAQVVNPDWISRETPALALALDWGRIYLAWVDETGAILLANSADGWTETIVVAPAGSSDVGPALAFDGNVVYVAWTSRDNRLFLATCDADGNVDWRPTEKRALSRPALTWSDGSLYVLTGGNLEFDDRSMRFYLSTDSGASFVDLPAQVGSSIGPPSLAVANGYHYLVWADGETSRLSFAATQDLTSYAPTRFSDGCHQGGPAVVQAGGLIAAWTYGAPPEDPRNHRLTLAKLPLSTAVPEMNPERYADTPQKRAKAPCPDPTTIWDPAKRKCVSKTGCWGACVTSSYSSAWGIGPVFNPIAYAACVALCKKG